MQSENQLACNVNFNTPEMFNQSMEDQALLNQPNQGKEIRKRRMLNISEKVELIRLMQTTPRKKKDIAAKFGIPINTVGAIYSNRERILGKCKGDFTNMNSKRLRPSSYPDIEEGLLDWYIENHTNGHISCLTLRTKALQVAKALGHDNFSASNGWIERFKSRHNLKFKRNKDKNMPSVVVNSPSDSPIEMSQSGNSRETYILSQIEPYENQVKENVTSPVMELTSIKQEYHDNSYDFNSESQTTSHQNGTDRIRESSPSPSHLIPEVHLMEAVSDNDNQICLHNNSTNFNFEMNLFNITIQNVENAFSIIQNYVKNCDGNVSEKTFEALKDLGTFISVEKKRKQQSKITDYFNLIK